MRIHSPGQLTDLAILEFGGSRITDCGDHLVIRTDANPGYYWGNFLLLEHPPVAAEVEGWTRRFEVEFPQAGHRAFALLTDDADVSPWLDRGYTATRDVALTSRSAPSAPPPDEVDVRALGPEDAESLVELALSEHDGEPDAAHLLFEERRTASQLALAATGQARWFGAFVAERLVGKAGIVVVGELARYQDVVTHASLRRRGIAAAVLAAAGEWALRQPGVGQLVIVAEDGGPAIGLYQRLGFREAAAHLALERRL